jgi:Tfp pilus assembly protein PilO
VSARDRIVVAVLAGFVALAAFWFVGVAPKRKQIAVADGQIAAQQQRLQKAQTVLAGAQDAKRAYPANSTEVARLGKAVPADDNVASLVYELQGLAHGAKITFRSLKLNATPNSATASAGASSATGSAAAGTSSTSTSGSTATAAPATQVAASQLPPGAVVGTAGLATLPFTFTFEGSYLDMQRFVARVNRFVAVAGKDITVTGRLLSVDGISLTPSPDAPSQVKATIAATAYIAPQTDAGTATGTDTGTGTGTGTTGSGTTPATGTATAPAAGTTSNSTSAVTAAPAGS